MTRTPLTVRNSVINNSLSRSFLKLFDYFYISLYVQQFYNSAPTQFQTFIRILYSSPLNVCILPVSGLWLRHYMD